MAIKHKVGGAWVEPKTPYVKAAGAWQKCKEIFVFKDGIWESVWTAASQHVVHVIRYVDNDTTVYGGDMGVLWAGRLGTITPTAVSDPNYSAPLYVEALYYVSNITNLFMSNIPPSSSTTPTLNAITVKVTRVDTGVSRTFACTLQKFGTSATITGDVFGLKNVVNQSITFSIEVV